MSLISNYTASPLGLIDDNFGYHKNGSTTGPPENPPTSDGKPNASQYNSIFSSTTKFRDSAGYGSNGLPPVLSGEDRHNDDVYNLTTSNIIAKLKNIKPLELDYPDFAYLKDYGVYPNNRLIVARRFPVPVMDDLYSERMGNENWTGASEDGQAQPIVPMSTILGYKKEDEEFIEFNVSERWEDADATFTKILNEIGNDFNMSESGFSGGLGNMLEGGMNALPLPGASLLFQRKLLRKLGILEGENISDIPVGDPNLIKAAKVRSLIGDDKAGSGLEGKISVKFTTIYEQKFIKGVDPTLVWMDILANILTMGTSNSNFYLGKTNGDTKLDQFVKDVIRKPMEKLKDFISFTVEVFKESIKKIIEAISGTLKANEETEEEQTDEEKSKELDSKIDDIKKSIQGAAGYVEDFISAKYRVRAFGVLAALSGAPSTPWHVTVGNPLRPIFCSGDMQCEQVDIKMGSVLAFNDLPSTIEVTVTLKSARDLGLQEIFSKFNSGGIRILQGKADPISGYTQNTKSLIEPATSFWSEQVSLDIYNEDGSYDESKSRLNSDQSDTDESNKENQSKVQSQSTEINSDPNSNLSTMPIGTL